MHIAVIEDHDGLRALLVESLLSQGHGAVGLASAEQLDAPDVPAFDVFIIDLNLPGEDGLSLSHRLRAAHPQVGIVMVSGRTQPSDRLAGYAHGADVYLVKPVLPDELLAVVTALSRRLPLRPVDAVTTGPVALMLDTVQLALVSALGCFELTPGEAALLLAMLQAPNRRLGLGRIADVLGLELHNMSKASLEVRVVRLRGKLTAAGATPPAIKAVRGYGYQLNSAITLKP